MNPLILATREFSNPRAHHFILSSCCVEIMTGIAEPQRKDSFMRLIAPSLSQHLQCFRLPVPKFTMHPFTTQEGKTNIQLPERTYVLQDSTKMSKMQQWPNLASQQFIRMKTSKSEHQKETGTCAHQKVLINLRKTSARIQGSYASVGASHFSHTSKGIAFLSAQLFT